jgi:hypothetical protein
MTASCTTEVGGLGIVSNHAYTFISEHLLSNGAKVFKLRNPWGQSEWTGAYRDADPFWTANPIDASNSNIIHIFKSLPTLTGFWGFGDVQSVPVVGVL